MKRPESPSSVLTKSPAEMIWADELNKMWTIKHKTFRKEAGDYICSCLSQSTLAYNTALVLFRFSQDYRKGKPQGLSYFVISTFDKWLASQDSSPSKLLTDDLRFASLWVSCEQPSTALIKQDKIQLVEDFISERPDLQIDLLKYLDNWIGDTDEIDHVLTRLDVPGIKREKLNKKTTNKLISRLMKLYNIEASVCPNLLYLRSKGALFYLLSRHSDSNWEDLVPDAVGSDVRVQKELVTNLFYMNDLPAAKQWAEYYKLDLEDFPDVVKNALMNPISNWEEENWNDDSSSNHKNEKPQNLYYSFNLSKDCIEFIDDKVKFDDFLRTVRKEKVVGVDAEWKPSFGKQQNRISILQLATSSHVYILDIITLSNKLYSKDWVDFFQCFFCNKDIKKVGFSISTDIQMFIKTVPVDGLALESVVSIIDWECLIPDLLKEDETIFPLEILSTGGVCSKLSHVIEIIFGKPLSKDEQFSDWEKRPLRESQVAYAALDAYCLVDLFQYIQKLCTDRNLNLSDMVIKSNTQKRKLKRTDIKVDNFGVTELTNVELFYVCCKCGEIFWKNSTFGDALENPESGTDILLSISEGTEEVLHEEWLYIPLNTIQDLYNSIPK
ncbi:Exonuclease mut-7 [Nymphon striatum]|nr:Exonuclease mut-7 [Nymphon striatum]